MDKPPLRDEPYGYMGFHATEAPGGEFETTPLTDADKAAGWSEIPLYARDAVLEEAATVCEGVRHTNMAPTHERIAKSTQNFCAKAIRAQKSDSPERLAADTARDELERRAHG